MDWYRISNLEQLDTPALVVYPERVKENIRLAVEMVGDVARLRPHVKTHKSPDTTAHYAKVDVATLQEIAQPWPKEDRSC